MKKALFCVGSPLQAICAVEALKYFQIDNYDFIILDDGKRLIQIKNYLDKYGIRFTVRPFHVKSYSKIVDLFKLFRLGKGVYDILFIGDFRLIGCRIRYSPLLKKNGSIIYLDDGNYIINLINDGLQYSTITKLRLHLLSVHVRLKKLNDNIFFTIFADYLHSNDGRYKIIKNNMALGGVSSKPLSTDIFIIGTIPLGEGGYCVDSQIDYDIYLKKIYNFLKQLSADNQSVKIHYIPHGRDNTNELKQICAKLGIDYYISPVCVELLISSLKALPSRIFGFGSTALYTLRMMAPSVEIINLTFKADTSKKTIYDIIADLYESMGIKNIYL